MHFYVMFFLFCYQAPTSLDEGDQLLSLEFSEIDLFLPHLTCGHGRPVSAKHVLPKDYTLNPKFYLLN